MACCYMIRATLGVSESTKFISEIPPTVIAKLLQYSGSRVKHRDEFSSYKLLIRSLRLVNSIWILSFDKNRGVGWLET